MDPQQQQLLAEILQQPQQKTLELKEYEAIQEHLRQQILNPKIMANNFWSKLFTIQRNGTTYPILMQNLNSPTISSTSTCNRNEIFTGYNSMMNTNYLPAVASSTKPLLNIPFIEETQTDELASFLVVDGLQKKTDSRKQTWQNLMLHQEIQLPQLTTQHELHQLVPSVSPFMKRRISESLHQQQEMESTQMTIIKRAKVTVIEQKDPQAAPCCSSNDSSRRSSIQRRDWSQENIKKLGSNIYGKRKGRNVKCDVDSHNENGENEDSEDVQYVDVESVDEKMDTKEQRKALIEFYRKVKTVRMSYTRDDMLICQMCEQKVQNSDSLILIHLYGHAEIMPYRCKMCGASECQLERIYAHIRLGHPNKLTDKICAVTKEKSLTKLTCMVCMKKISTRRNSLTRHAQTHLHYRCKDCGIILFDETAIIKHGAKKHDIVNSQRTTHYDACINTSDKRQIALHNCFGNILNEKL